ncbi:MAG: CHAT domain-containing tetratricopeptide repeat protein [Deltaproteobacteria bacterium]
MSRPRGVPTPLSRPALLFLFLAPLLATAACRPTGPRPIAPDTPIDAPLAPGQTPRFLVAFNAGDFVEIVAVQDRIDLRLRAGPKEAEATYDLERVGGVEGQESIGFIASTDAVWWIEVSATVARARPGRFRLEVTSRPATAKDRARAEAYAELERARALAKSNDEGADVEAERAWKRAEARWEALEEPLFVAYAIDRRGALMKHLGRRSDGVALRARALEIRERIDDRFGQLVSGIGLGNLAAYFGDHDEAIARYERALELSVAIDDGLGESICLVNLGIQYTARARYDDALASLQRGVDVLRRNGQEHKTGLALHKMGVVHLALGDPHRAIELFERALELRREHDEPKTVPEVLSDLAVAHADLGELETALTLAQSAYDKRGELTFGSDRKGFALDLVGSIHRRRGRADLALPLHAQALALHEANGSKIGVADNRLLAGRALAALEKYDEAERALSESVELNRSLGYPRDVAVGLAATASVAARRGDVDRALALVVEATSIVESIRSELGAARNRSTYVASMRELYDLHVALMLERYRRKGAVGDAYTAFVLSERARARTMLEGLRARAAGIDVDVPSSLAAERQRDLRTFRATERDLRSAQQGGDAAKIEAAHLAVDTALATIDRLDARIAKKSPRFAALSDPPTSTLAQIQQNIPPDTTLAVYLLGHDRAVAWRFTRSSFDVVELGPADAIRELARSAHAQLTARNTFVDESSESRRRRILAADASFERTASQLGARVLAPLGPIGPNLIVVPDGPLHLVPFAAIPVDGAALVETTNTWTAPSASVLVESPDRKERSTTTGLLAIADPVFDTFDTRAPPAPPAATTMPLPRLAFSAEEVRRIEALFETRKRPTRIVQGFDATRAFVLEGGLATQEVVHLATHAIVDDRRPERSVLVLSQVDEQGEAVDGRLGVHDIYGLRLNAELVVLSACDSARGAYVSGEGLVGLTRAFLFAGSRAVLGSLWRVHDRGAGPMLTRFHEARLDGATPAAALRAAQRALRREARWRAPYYWAPFVLHVASARASDA